MAVPAKKFESVDHGTKYGYNRGCRCDACTKANSASAWAERKIRQWDGDVAEALRNGVAFVGDVTITAEEIYAALTRRQKMIKTDVLMWRRLKETT